MPESVTSRPLISGDEFRELGYLQEVNRLFFHPLGLALAARPGKDEFTVFDSRDDPEGVYFDGGDLGAKADRVAAELAARSPSRERALGWIVQPVEESA